MALDAFDTHLQTMIEQYLTTSDRATLDALLDNTTGSAQPVTGRYPLTELKHISQSMRPSVIAGRVDLFNQLKRLFVPLAPLIARLDLADDTIQYYAQYVIDNRSVHLAGSVHEHYRRLLAFIVHQYLCVGDALILTLQRAVVLILNDCEDKLKEHIIRAAR